MIYAHIDDAKNYFGLGDVFAWALRQLARDDLKSLPAGKTELIPGKAWYSIDEPTTRPREQVPFEAHREFIDIQMTLSGDERIGCAPLPRRGDDARLPAGDVRRVLPGRRPPALHRPGRTGQDPQSRRENSQITAWQEGRVKADSKPAQRPEDTKTQ